MPKEDTPEKNKPYISTCMYCGIEVITKTVTSRCWSGPYYPDAICPTCLEIQIKKLELEDTNASREPKS